MLTLDSEKLQNLLKNNTRINHPALRDPELDPEQYVADLVAQHNKNYPQDLDIEELEQNIKNIQESIEQIKTQVLDKEAQKLNYVNKVSELKPQIESNITKIQVMLPAKDKDKVEQSFGDEKYLLNLMQRGMGMMDKLFKAKKRVAEFEKLYSQTREMLSELGVDDPPALNARINQKVNVMSGDIRRLNEQLSSLESRLKAEQGNLMEQQQVHDGLSEQMHQAVADFMHAYGDGHLSRTELRKQIPVTLNMQGLKEPVSFFQTITYTTKQELENLLQHAGLPVGNGPSDYMVREVDNGKLELITPFYSPNAARKNIETLMRYLAAHTIKFAGVIKPATYAQINPSQKHTKDIPNANSVMGLIDKKLHTKGVMDRQTFATKYAVSENNGKYLFRGHSFATADTASSYATPTWRVGRTGIVYATNAPLDAMRYASNFRAGDIQTQGGTMDIANRPQLNGFTIGFLSVYKNSKRSPVVGDFDLEEVSTGRELKEAIHNAEKQNVKETIVSPHNNPLVERYMVVGDKLAKIDDNDPEWRQILDAMAPDLSQTHITGTAALKPELQKQHGANLLRRIDALADQVAQHGAVQTHDIPQELLLKMGYKNTKQVFEHGIQTLQSKISAPSMTMHGVELE